MTVEGKIIKSVKIVRTLKIDVNGQLVKNQILEIYMSEQLQTNNQPNNNNLQLNLTDSQY